MSQIDAPLKNFGLSAAEFEGLVSQLKLGNTELFKAIFINHFDDCVSFVRRKYSATHDDAYDASMATILEFRKRLISDKIVYGNLRFLFTTMASQHFLRKKKSASTEDLEQVDIVDEADAKMDDEDYQRLSVAWKGLDPDCRELLTMNFYGEMKLAEIAEHFDKSAAAIRKQKERCKKKLIDLFKEKTN